MVCRYGVGGRIVVCFFVFRCFVVKSFFRVVKVFFYFSIWVGGVDFREVD